MKEAFSNNSVKLFLLLSLVSLLFLGHLNEYVPPDIYEYNISGQRVHAIRDLVIYHNFETNKGSVSFEISKNDYEADKEVAVSLQLPRKVQKESIKVYVEKEENREWDFEENNETIVILGFEKNNYTKEYSINYDLNIIPRGEFFVIHPGLELIGHRPILKFDLSNNQIYSKISGEEFLCMANCLEGLGNMEFARLNTEKNVRLLLNRATPSHWFTLNTIKDIRIPQGIALGSLVSALFALLITIKEIYEKKRD